MTIRPNAILVGAVTATLIALAPFGAGAPAHAQPKPAQSVDLQLFRPTPDTWGLFSQRTSFIPEPFQLSAGFFYNYQRDPLVLRERGRVLERVVSDQQTANLLFAIAATRFLEVGVDLPIHVRMDGRGGQLLRGLQNPGVDHFGLGDLRLDLKWRLIGQGRAGFGLALLTPFTLPTAGEERFRGAAGLTFSPGVILDYAFSRATIALNLGYLARQRVDFGTLRFDDELYYGLGGAVVVMREEKEGRARDRITLIAEVNARTSAITPFKNLNQNPMEILGGARFGLPYDLHASVGFGTGLQAGYGVPDIRVFAGLQWTPTPPPPRKPEPVLPTLAPLPTRTPVSGYSEAPGDLPPAAPELAVAVPELPEPPKVEPPPPPKPQEVVVRLRKMYFKFDKWEPRKRSLVQVDRLVGIMKKWPALKVSIEGHTDNIGPAKYNKTLSQKRADAIKKYVVSKGIEAERVAAIGYGKERPIASNKTLGGRRLNRRVELRFTNLPPELKLNVRPLEF